MTFETQVDIGTNDVFMLTKKVAIY